MADGARVALPYPEVAVIEREHARRAERGRGRGAWRAADRRGRMLLHPRRCSTWSCAPSRTSRGRLDRCAWRSQHARDVAVGEPLGDAVSDDSRRWRTHAPRTPRSSARGASIRPKSSSWVAPASTTRSSARSTGADATVRRARPRRARPERGRRPHPRAGRALAGRRSNGSYGTSRSGRRSRGSA